MKTRKPIVSGKFYPSKKNELTELFDKILAVEIPKINNKLSNKTIIGAVVPHAAYIYSGYSAVHVFDILKNSNQTFDTFVIINPNHTGYGRDISFDNNDFWETPLGKVEIDKKFISNINFPVSDEAHTHEHSGEVMLPFLQYFYKNKFKIVPITMSLQNFKNASLICEEIYKTAKLLDRKIFIIASSDFSHYVNPEIGQSEDIKVVEKIVNFESELMIDYVKKQKLSICGIGPIAVLTEYSKKVSEKPKAELLRFGNSGEFIEADKVVDYASILFYDDLII